MFTCQLAASPVLISACGFCTINKKMVVSVSTFNI